MWTASRDDRETARQLQAGARSSFGDSYMQSRDGWSGFRGSDSYGCERYSAMYGGLGHAYSYGGMDAGWGQGRAEVRGAQVHPMWIDDPPVPAKRSEVPGASFLFEDALSEVSMEGFAEAESGLAAQSFVEVDPDLYTNVVLSILSPMDTLVTRILSLLLVVLVACLQWVLGFAIHSHVIYAMSWTNSSVTAQSMHELYDDLLHDGRLQYIRLEPKDVTQLCGDFQYDLIEQGLWGTNWTAYYEYSKVPVDNWHPWDIPPTDRSDLDTARFVLENKEYMCVYIIVTFIWILTIINEMRLIFQSALAIMQLPTAAKFNDKLLQQDGDEYQIVAITGSAKFVGLSCAVYRICITMYITWVGCQFLMWTATNIDLILNALALTFVLELGHITYKAAISSSRQNLVNKLKSLRWADPTGLSPKYPNALKMTMLVVVLGFACLITWGLRDWQHRAYTKMFQIVAATCLFQGPTPGYWSQFSATFPAPGLCETLLELRCEAPIVGDEGRPCVEDWSQKLCKFYLKTDSMFSTWSSVNWTAQGPCVAYVDGRGPYPVSQLHIVDDGSTFSTMAKTCQMMWQQQPQIRFQGEDRSATGPRVRVYPYKDFMPAAPFWCKYRGGSREVLRPYQPAEAELWKEALQDCRGTTLVYSETSSAASWLQREETETEERIVGEADNMTAHQSGSFSGIWLSKTWGVVVISHQGDKARISNPNLEFSSQEGTVNGTILTMPQEGLTAELKDDGKIYFSNGIVCVSQEEEIKKMAARSSAQKESENVPHPFGFRLFR
mmetsp:Transcript_42803/g.123726  ORF Transcript_42803/g.123726 Transcript_42803/m.123726 type:complete len:780 (-) Transcript_42803:197-2536(-)